MQDWSSPVVTVLNIKDDSPSLSGTELPQGKRKKKY